MHAHAQAHRLSSRMGVLDGEDRVNGKKRGIAEVELAVGLGKFVTGVGGFFSLPSGNGGPRLYGGRGFKKFIRGFFAMIVGG